MDECQIDSVIAGRTVALSGRRLLTLHCAATPMHLTLRIVHKIAVAEKADHDIVAVDVGMGVDVDGSC